MANKDELDSAIGKFFLENFKKIKKNNFLNFKTLTFRIFKFQFLNFQIF